MSAIATETPVGTLRIVANDDAVTAVTWGGMPGGDETGVLAQARRQLAEYFDGERDTFDLPLRVGGSDQQRAVCAAMQAIPFGETRTYGEIAADLGLSAQAVGQLCGGNPIPIIIPCHRVLGAGGRMTGFSGAGGVETKVWLLRHERAAGLLI